MLDDVRGTSGSETQLSHAKGGAGLRSPAYAFLEVLGAEEAAVEATGRPAGAAAVSGLEATITTFEEGQIVRGTVTELRENEVIIDVGFKSEGTIPAAEFRSVDNLAVGMQFDVLLEKLENQDGLVVLSKEKADFFK
ncbi:MAG: S1 RNA-binding domain-containing protein, partial [Planctomycetia bacterium]|nr:S1 RNA-binding domain-containing protein [Planctomycetia bacterium]